MRFVLQEGLPLLNTKKLHTRSIFIELLWFLRGDTNIQYLKDHNVRIWDPWADEDGNLGPVYGYQWRSWPTPDGGHVDQIKNLLQSLTQNPNSRRHSVCAWNVGQIDQMWLPSCPCLFSIWPAAAKLSSQLPHPRTAVCTRPPLNTAPSPRRRHMSA